MMKGIDGVDPVGQTGGVRVAGEDPDGEVGVQLPQFPDDGLQNGVISGVAPAIGSAHQRPVPAARLPRLAAENGAVDLQLTVQGAFQRELAAALFVEAASHVLPKRPVLGQCGEMAGEGLGVCPAERGSR